MQQVDVQAPCDQAPAAAVVVAAAEAVDDVDRVMLAGNADDDDDADAHAEVLASSILSCCYEQTPVAKSAACPGRSVFPAQQKRMLHTECSTACFKLNEDYNNYIDMCQTTVLCRPNHTGVIIIVHLKYLQ